MLEQNVFFTSRGRHTRFDCDWSSDVCSSDLRGLWASGLSLLAGRIAGGGHAVGLARKSREGERSEEHTSELQSQSNLVCRLLLEKKNHLRRHYLSLK